MGRGGRWSAAKGCLSSTDSPLPKDTTAELAGIVFILVSEKIWMLSPIMTVASGKNDHFKKGRSQNEFLPNSHSIPTIPNTTTHLATPHISLCRHTKCNQKISCHNKKSQSAHLYSHLWNIPLIFRNKTCLETVRAQPFQTSLGKVITSIKTPCSSLLPSPSNTQTKIIFTYTEEAELFSNPFFKFQ